ncbi:SDR family oxidoreductase [Myxococcota bacterium]|nr:SDR family oxidoreductase [Myxococcota bacterium]
MTDRAGRLEGKVAVVTGGASGIGRATVLRMAAEGARVVVADLNGVGADGLAAEVRAGGGEAIAVRTDVGEEADIARMITAALDAFGRIDVLHNNAAVTSPELLAGDGAIEDLDTELWDQTMRINLRGPMLGVKHALPHMLAQGRGSIVNTSSTAGFVGDGVYGAYGSSKGGLNAFTAYVATMYGKRGIRCNAVAPGLVATPNAREHFDPRILEIYESNHLTRTLGTPDDVARVVVFLASDEASFVTGQVVKVDGGLLSHFPTWAQLHRPKP